MHTREYSKHLGLLSPDQFQAALNRFGLGNFLHTEPIPFGLFGQMVYLTSTDGEFVLRGRPHFPWQFPKAIAPVKVLPLLMPAASQSYRPPPP